MVQPCPFAGDRDPEARKGRGPLDDRGVEGWSGVGDLGTSEAKACFQFLVLIAALTRCATQKNFGLIVQEGAKNRGRPNEYRDPSTRKGRGSQDDRGVEAWMWCR